MSRNSAAGTMMTSCW